MRNIKTLTQRLEELEKLLNGGAGSGDFGHFGRPGKVGGSADANDPMRTRTKKRGVEKKAGKGLLAVVEKPANKEVTGTEAVKYLTENGKIVVGSSKLNQDMAKAIVEAEQEVEAEYGVSLENVQYGSKGALSKILNRMNFRGVGNRSMGTSVTALENHRTGETTEMQYVGFHGDGWNKGDFGETKADQESRTYQAYIDKGVANPHALYEDGFSSKYDTFHTAFGLKATARHELGHSLMNNVSLNMQGKKSQTVAEHNKAYTAFGVYVKYQLYKAGLYNIKNTRRSNNYGFGWDTKQMSRYGASKANLSEAIAESVSNPNYSKATKVIDKAVKQLAKDSMGKYKDNFNQFLSDVDDLARELNKELYGNKIMVKRAELEKIKNALDTLERKLNGGAGSGDFGHLGRPGMVGGSASKGSKTRTKTQKRETEKTDTQKPSKKSVLSETMPESPYTVMSELKKASDEADKFLEEHKKDADKQQAWLKSIEQADLNLATARRDHTLDRILRSWIDQEGDNISKSKEEQVKREFYKWAGELVGDPSYIRSLPFIKDTRKYDYRKEYRDKPGGIDTIMGGKGMKAYLEEQVKEWTEEVKKRMGA